MTGTRVFIQDRDRRLLEALEQLVVIDREQAQLLGPFGSVARANARLLALTRAGLLRRSFLPLASFGRKTVYRLPRHSGGRLIERRVVHQLTLNRIYLWLRSTDWLATWQPCTRAVGGIRLVPDAYGELTTAAGTKPVFVEADCGTEPLSIWKKKAEAYRVLASSGAFAAEFGHQRFRVLVVAPTPRRARSISAAIGTVTTKLFWISSLENINRAGAGAAIWLRPGAANLVSLITPCATVDRATSSVPVNLDSVQPAGKATT